MEANAGAAAGACGLALAIDPGMVPARNNLALAKAVDGDMDGAAEMFAAGGGDAAAHYNLGIVYLVSAPLLGRCRRVRSRRGIAARADAGTRPRTAGAPARRRRVGWRGGRP